MLKIPIDSKKLRKSKRVSRKLFTAVRLYSIDACGALVDYYKKRYGGIYIKQVRFDIGFSTLAAVFKSLNRAGFPDDEILDIIEVLHEKIASIREEEARDNRRKLKLVHSKESNNE